MSIEEEKPVAEINKNFLRIKYAIVGLVILGIFVLLEIIKNQDTLAKGIFLGVIFSMAPITCIFLWYEKKFQKTEEDNE